MDNFVQNILKQWGLEVLIHNFNEHAVDEKTFYSLNEDAIKEIIPQWGWRNKFSNKYVIFNKESELQQTCSFDVDRLSHRLRKSFPNLTENPELFLPSTSTDIYVSKIRSVPPSRAISLKSFLRSCLRGNIILQTYKNHSTVDRSLLCGMIIERELDSNVNYKITKERFLELTDSICELFPTEERDLYYIPSTRHESLSVNARGSLYNSYNEWRRLIAQAGLLKNLEIEVTAEQSPEPENDDVNWLKNNFEPINDIISKWKATYDHRLEWTNKTIDEYFDTFPCLKGPEGYKLLLLDFDHNYESKRDSLITKWPDIAKKIMKFTAKKRNPYIKTCLKKLNKFINTDKETLLAFLLLPLLLPTPTFKSKKPDDSHSPTKEFIQKSFLLYAESNTEIREFMEEKTKFYNYHKLSYQPYVVVYETDGELMSSVRVNEIIYNLETPELAIDCCIKICYSLNAKFSKECELPWIFLAQYVYDLPIPKKVLSVIDLIKDLKTITFIGIIYIQTINDNKIDYNETLPTIVLRKRVIFITF